ncbi:MAG: methyltransferase domain-containing protein [Angustibacter sp.]
MISWDPALYGQFAAERARPAADLLARVDATDVHRVVDLGCGTGAVTATLARRWASADVLGVDSSPTMLEQARAMLEQARAMLEQARDQTDASDIAGRLTFVTGDLSTWVPDPAARPDVVVANASLQWVPGHLDLLSSWVSGLAPGGWLAIQVPGNFDAPSHQLMREVAAEPRFATLLAGALRHGEAVGRPATYAALLADRGCAVEAWETTYVHLLDPAGEHGDDAVLAWVSGTGLRPIMDALHDHPQQRQEFLDAYAGRLRMAYPRRPWGTPYEFRRVFCVAQVLA